MLRLGLLLLVVALGYCNTLHDPFVFDDVTSIVYNPSIHSLTPFGKIFERTNDLDITPWGRPLVTISLALNYAWGKLDSFGYHLVNILIHLLNGLLLWGLARHLLREQKWSPQCAASADSLGFVIALLWLAHPIATSVATYTVQRAESMMVFFYLATLYSGAKFWSSPKKAHWALLSVLACSLGMLAKESMVTAPVAVLFLGRIFFQDSFLFTVRTCWIWVLGLASSWLVLLWTMTTWPRHASVGFGVRGMDGWEYLLIQIRVILHYFAMVFWPINLCLSYPQRFWPTMQDVPPNTWPLVRNPWEVWPEALLLLSIVGFTLWLLWKRPGLGFLPCMAFLILAPTSSVIPIATSLAADHRMYLPSAALIALVVLLFFLFTARAPKQDLKAIYSLRLSMVLLVCLLLLGTTWNRNNDYRDGHTIWEKSLQLHPRDALGWSELGSVYFVMKDLPGARAAYAQGSGISSTYLLPRSNLAVCQWNLGQRQQAIDNLLVVTKHEPKNLNAWRNLANYLEQLHENDRARNCYQRILQIIPNDKAARDGINQLSVSPLGMEKN